MTTFKFRRFKPEDNIRVCEVFARSLSDLLLRAGDEALVDLEDPQDWQRFWDRRKALFNHLSRTGDSWLAEDNQRIVGYARSICRDGLRLVLNERLGLRRALGIVVAIVGIICLTGEPKIQDAWPYALLVVEGAFMFAFGQVLLKRLSHVGGHKLIAWVAVCSAPQLFLASWIFEHNQLEAIRAASTTVWFPVFYMAVIMTAIGYGLWYRLLRRYELNQVVPFLLIEPLAAVIGGMLFLGEQLTVIIVIGGVIIAGVAVIVIERNPFASKNLKRGQSD